MLGLAVKLSATHKIVIITDRAERNAVVNKNVEIYLWPSRRPTKLKDFLFLYKLVRRHKPTVMISLFGAVNLFTIVGCICRVNTRIAFVQTLSTQFPASNYLIIRKKIVYKFCTDLFANSNATKQDLINTFAVSAEKINIVYNAVKIPVSHAAETFININQILYVGRLHPSKGVLTLIEAFSRINLEYPALKLSIVGGELDSEYALSCINLVNHLELNSKITFFGSLPKIKVLDLFSESYFTVVPSIVEAFGFVVIESFSVKTPVIGSNSSGIREIIRNGKDGILFETNNSEDLASQMVGLISNKDLRERMSHNCYQRFLESFEMDVLIGEIEDFINLKITISNLK